MKENNSISDNVCDSKNSSNTICNNELIYLREQVSKLGTQVNNPRIRIEDEYLDENGNIQYEAYFDLSDDKEKLIDIV